jgi:hypothetical protein
MQYDQRNQMKATRALYDLVYRSYKCFKKCNATYKTPCIICVPLSTKTSSPLICLPLDQGQFQIFVDCFFPGRSLEAKYPILATTTNGWQLKEIAAHYELK